MIDAWQQGEGEVEEGIRRNVSDLVKHRPGRGAEVELPGHHPSRASAAIRTNRKTGSERKETLEPAHSHSPMAAEASSVVVVIMLGEIPRRFSGPQAGRSQRCRAGLAC